MSLAPFVIKVDQSVLDDLRMRIDHTRWPCDHSLHS